jgi:hypothetical protein
MGSTDPSAREAAKLELKSTAHPDVLPVLLKALPTATGCARLGLVEILAVYKDPRKIAALVQVAKQLKTDMAPSLDKGGLGFIEIQLVELGTPAASALMESITECSNETLPYAGWVGAVVGDMGAPGLAAIFAGLRSGDPCREVAGGDGLVRAFMHSEAGAELTALDVNQSEMMALVRAAQSEDEETHAAAVKWIEGLAEKFLEKVDYATFVEALITAYRTAPAETMISIARILAEVKSLRVLRFMNAAVNAPHPEIQGIARKYLAEHRRQR